MRLRRCSKQVGGVDGNRTLTSERFEVLVRPETAPRPSLVKVHGLRGADVAAARPMNRVRPDPLHYVGGRPVLDYYIDFNVCMLDRYVLRHIQTKLPKPRVEVSRLCHDRKYGDGSRATWWICALQRS